MGWGIRRVAGVYPDHRPALRERVAHPPGRAALDRGRAFGPKWQRGRSPHTAAQGGGKPMAARMTRTPTTIAARKRLPPGGH